uniref:Uncharacterized protein n=1 Tax=Emiliania huxleyi TaxID=2903 RepID=A0A7S3TH00_EMIHU|mmetsp:Transcript_24791/g.72479  ORF Transcript_24791/g.72479 Transcript_24791/m.72479 type:complete len:172 (-) Transcript_24791:116-631(-)
MLRVEVGTHVCVCVSRSHMHARARTHARMHRACGTCSRCSPAVRLPLGIPCPHARAPQVGPRESERGCCTVARTFTPGEPAHRVEQVQVEAEGLVAELERLAALKEEERDAAAERAVADKGMTHNGSWKIAAVGGRGKSSAAAAAPPSESAAEAPARSAEPTRKRAKVVKF